MPTFDDILPRLVASYECGRLVPFIGSGMSIPACVDWQTLVENLEGAAAADGVQNDHAGIPALTLSAARMQLFANCRRANQALFLQR